MSEPYPLIFVRWIDSARPTAAWVALEDIDNDWAQAIECQSVGWQLPSDDSVIMLAQNLGDVHSESEAATPQACGIIRIPRCAVTSIAYLRGESPMDRLPRAWGRGAGNPVAVPRPLSPDQYDITRKPA